MKVPNPRETIILAGFFLLGNLGNCLYASVGRPPSSTFLLLYYAGVFWAIAAWIIADARRLGVAMPFDIGWFALFAWPIVLPYYIFKTRRSKGFITLAGLVGMFIAAYFVSLVVFFALIAFRHR